MSITIDEATQAVILKVVNGTTITIYCDSMRDVFIVAAAMYGRDIMISHEKEGERDE